VSSATVTKAEPKATITEPKAPFLSHKRSDSHTHGVSEHFRTRSRALKYDQRVGHTNGAETPLYYSNSPQLRVPLRSKPLADSNLVTDGRWKINSPYATLARTYGSKSHLKAGSYRASHSVLVTVNPTGRRFFPRKSLRSCDRRTKGSRDQAGAPKAIARCATLHHSPIDLIRDPQAPFV
jgi:hypothetical protein